MKDEKQALSRRNFLKILGTASIGLSITGYGFPRYVTAEGLSVIPLSKGYLLVDSQKCAGCMTCMLACSLVHEGKENLSLSRIQVIQNPFKGFPEDVIQAQCRQCVTPECVKACPTEACHVDKRHGNVRLVDKEKCISCMDCLEACPFVPARALYNFESGYAQKCDLCADTPFWNEAGGPGGKQVCVEVCPVTAIQFTEKAPIQEGDKGYNVNLRNNNWEKLGFRIS